MDIEELRGLEFHQLMQTDKSVEKLGLQLMQLARKAFSSLSEKELDRLHAEREVLSGSVAEVAAEARGA